MATFLLAYAATMLAVATIRRGASCSAMPSKRATPSTNEEAKQVGEALRILRERRRVTQEAAAEAMEVSRTAWQNYEGGRPVVLRTDVQVRLAAAVGASREDLIGILRGLQRGNAGASHSALGVEEMGTVYAGPGRAQAIFPTSEGDVIVSYPAALSAAGYKELGEYLALFLRRGERA